MTLTTASDPVAWCHAELDPEDLPDSLVLAAAETHGVALDEVVLPQTDEEPADEVRLTEAIELLEADVQGGSSRVRVHDLRDAVLAVWDMADEAGSEASEPLELLLGRLTTTTRVSRGAVTAALEEARRRLHEPSRSRR